MQTYYWVAARFIMGALFLWAFLDKTFGLGFATAKEGAWIAGGSPTAGFLTYAVKGPFAGIFEAMAGSVIVDVLFMLGLLGVSLALILGLVIKFASYSGTAMVLLMWLAQLPPEHHPILDEHIVYALVFVGLATLGVKSGETLGLAKWVQIWKK